MSDTQRCDWSCAHRIAQNGPRYKENHEAQSMLGWKSILKSGDKLAAARQDYSVSAIALNLMPFNHGFMGLWQLLSHHLVDCRIIHTLLLFDLA